MGAGDLVGGGVLAGDGELRPTKVVVRMIY